VHRLYAIHNFGLSTSCPNLGKSPPPTPYYYYVNAIHSFFFTDEFVSKVSAPMILCHYRSPASQRQGLPPLVLKDTQDEDWDRKVSAVPLLSLFWLIPKSRRVFRKWHRHTLRPSISLSCVHMSLLIVLICIFLALGSWMLNFCGSNFNNLNFHPSPRRLLFRRPYHLRCRGSSWSGPPEAAASPLLI